MKSSLNFLFKILVSGIILGGALGLVSCGSNGNNEEPGSATYLSLTKDGGVQSHIEESFEESYYDIEELQNTILSQAADYNREAGSSRITVDKVEAKDAMAVVQMTYENPEDYAGFNDNVLFVGTAREAQEAGYELNVILSGVKDSNETVAKSDILAMEDEKLLITDVKESIVLDGKALYVSDNVTVSGNAKEVYITEGESAPAYVVFK